MSKRNDLFMLLLVFWAFLSWGGRSKKTDDMDDMKETTNQDSLRAFVFGRKRKTFPWD